MATASAADTSSGTVTIGFQASTPCRLQQLQTVPPAACRPETMADYKRAPEESAADVRCCASKCSRLTWLGVLGGLTVAFLVAALYLPVMIRRKVEDGLIIDSPDAPRFKYWADTTQPGAPETIQSFQFFNTTNPVGIMNGEKANLQMMPLVRYRVYTKRLLPTFSEDKKTASCARDSVCVRVALMRVPAGT